MNVVLEGSLYMPFPIHALNVGSWRTFTPLKPNLEILRDAHNGSHFYIRSSDTSTLWVKMSLFCVQSRIMMSF